MNICFIGKHVLQPVFADNQLDVPLFREFSQRFDQVFLVYQTDGPVQVESCEGNIRMFLLPRGGPGFRWPRFVWQALGLVRRLHREYGVDVVSLSDPLGAGLAGVLARWRSQVKIVMQLQGQVLRLPPSEYSPLRRWLTRWLTVFLCRYADAVRCVSSGIREEALAAGVADTKLIMIPSRCDTDLFDPARWIAARQQVRKEYGIAPEQWLVSFVGRVEPAKGAIELLEALAQVKEIQALLIGTVPQPEVIGQILQAASMSNRVKLVGPIPHEQIPRYLSASDIFVLPSKHDAIPRVVLEAMAMELPVVGSSIGGIPEAIDDGSNGLLLKENTGDEIAHVFRRAMSNHHEFEAMGAAARRYVLENHSFKPLVTRLIDLHEQVAMSSNEGRE